ncbi:MAG: hypothetical protein K5829_12685 [Treponema sp.]|nr:hypothetical protein [Treponema sp.]
MKKIFNLKKFNIYLISFFLIVLSASCSSPSYLKLESAFGDLPSDLIALNSAAKKNKISKSGFASYKFNENQKDSLRKHLNETGSGALVVRIKFNPSEKDLELLETMPQMPVKFGFLYPSDFSSRGKFISKDNPANEKITVQGNLINFIKRSDELKENGKIIDISLAFSAEKGIPEGFFIFSSIHSSIENVCLAPVQVGFDCSLSLPFYGFPSNGGSIRFDNSGFDFTGGNLVFPTKNSSKSFMPEYLVKLDSNPDLKSSIDNSIAVEINFGGEKLFIKNVIQADQFTIPAASLKNPFSGLEILDNANLIKSIILKDNSLKASSEKAVTEAIKLDPGLILNYPLSNWRTKDYELFAWDRLPGILFFDTRNYDVQARFFTRLAYFVEKAGYKGRLLSNSELEGLHGYNAHDYSAESLAKFFNKASELNFELNYEELLLKEILIKNGFLESDGNMVKAKSGGLVSISQESLPYLRVQLLAHEGWHTIFFTDDEYRNYVAAVYYTMDDNARTFLTDYFKSQKSLGYDTEDEYLMVNEFMAYTMQQRYSRVSKYFVDHAKWASVKAYTPELAAYIVNTNAASFEDAAVMMNDFVFNKYGIECGSISLILR